MNSFRYGLITLTAVFCNAVSAGSLFGSKPPPPAPAADGAPVTATEPGADTPVAPAQSQAAFDDRFYIAPMFSYTPAANNRNSDDGIGGTLAIGKSLVPHLSVEVLGDYLRYKGKTDTEIKQLNGEVCAVGATSAACPSTTTHYPNSNLYGGGVGANVYLLPSNSGFFLHADVMDGKRFVYDGGPGIDLPLGTSQRFALRGEALYHKEAHFKADPEFNLGLVIHLGKAPEVASPPPPPEPVAVVPVEAPSPPPPLPPCELPSNGDTIDLAGCKVGDTLVLRGVNFDFNKATLTLNAQTILDAVSTALASRSDLKVEIDGHTDGKGSVAYNNKLSELRAESVKTYLVGKGIDASRLSTRGFGKSRPIADNSTQEGRDENRRVELKVLESGGTTDVPLSSATGELAAPPADAATPAAAESPPAVDAPPP